MPRRGASIGLLMLLHRIGDELGSLEVAEAAVGFWIDSLSSPEMRQVASLRSSELRKRRGREWGGSPKCAWSRYKVYGGSAK